MTVLYFIIYLMVGLFLITILNYAMDGPTNDLDGGSILLILGWPIVIGTMLVFGIIYGIWSIAKAIGIAIYNWTWR